MKCIFGIETNGDVVNIMKEDDLETRARVFWLRCPLPTCTYNARYRANGEGPIPEYTRATGRCALISCCTGDQLSDEVPPVQLILPL